MLSRAHVTDMQLSELFVKIVCMYLDRELAYLESLKNGYGSFGVLHSSMERRLRSASGAEVWALPPHLSTHYSE